MSRIDNAVVESIDKIFAFPKHQLSPEAHLPIIQGVLEGLNFGVIRAVEPDETSSSGWRVNGWVKKAILLGFRLGEIVDMSTMYTKIDNLAKTQLPWCFFDKNTFPLKNMVVQDGVRIVPGGSSIRFGAYVAPGVVCMPPMYINVGAYVDENSMIDSHALVGSCAQIGKRCHISAGTQIGGVLEPVGALPVIVEDDVTIGGNCGIYEGAVIKRRVVLGSGVILTASTKVYDIVNETVYAAGDGQPLVIPENAVVIPGSRPVVGPSAWAERHQLQQNIAIIKKYRDAKTNAKTALEEALR